MISNTDKDLVRASWASVEPISATAADIFYDNLFALDPSLKPLFKGNMEEQGGRLMSMIGVAVNALDRPDDLASVVSRLGARHYTYGVKDEDYDTVAEALLKTLSIGLQDDFTSEVEAAWVNVYTLLATVMKTAAKVEEERLRGS